MIIMKTPSSKIKSNFRSFLEGKFYFPFFSTKVVSRNIYIQRNIAEVDDNFLQVGFGVNNPNFYSVGADEINDYEPATVNPVVMKIFLRLDNNYDEYSRR
jgi:hypothetical protein